MRGTNFKTIYVTDDQEKALDSMQKFTGMSRSLIIRNALDLYETNLQGLVKRLITDQLIDSKEQQS